ncbi:MAG: iron-containing alcohol dehydrogenase family protein [Planctomycetota bacterium]
MIRSLVRPLPRLVSGAGCLGELPKVLAGKRSISIFTDSGLRNAGHPQRATSLLESAGHRVAVFDSTEENPDSRHVESARDFIASVRPDAIVAIGGGSSMDLAKAANLIHCCGGRVGDYHGYGKATAPLLPMAGIPTTTGTGSEAQSYAVIVDRQTHLKMACGDPGMLFGTVLLDPELVSSQPRGVAAVTGLDALSHALEAAVTTARNPLSLSYAREAWRLLSANFGNVLARTADVATFGAMQWGAFLAGAAIEQSMLGASHAMANPLTAHYGLTHGIAIALVLPWVIRFNARAVSADYRELAREAGLGDQGAEGLALKVEEWRSGAALPSGLGSCGVRDGILAILAEEASQQWTGRFNPAPVTESDFLSLYRSAM